MTCPWVGSSSRGTSTCVEVAAGTSAAGESCTPRSEMVFRSKVDISASCRSIISEVSFPKIPITVGCNVSSSLVVMYWNNYNQKTVFR